MSLTEFQQAGFQLGYFPSSAITTPRNNGGSLYVSERDRGKTLFKFGSQSFSIFAIPIFLMSYDGRCRNLVCSAYFS